MQLQALVKSSSATTSGVVRPAALAAVAAAGYQPEYGGRPVKTSYQRPYSQPSQSRNDQRRKSTAREPIRVVVADDAIKFNV